MAMGAQDVELGRITSLCETVAGGLLLCFDALPLVL